MLEFHPSARSNFDSKAFELISTLKILDQQQRPDFKTEIPTKTIAGQVIGEIRKSIGDYKGRIVGQTFFDGVSEFGIVGSDYQKLKQLAENIQRNPSVFQRVGAKFVENAIFNWIEERVKKKTDLGFVEYLEKLANPYGCVKKYVVRVPIACTVLESSFDFCGARIENLTSAQIDEFQAITIDFDEKKKGSSDQFFEKFRNDFQGRTVITLRLECEPKYAETVSIEKAQEIAKLLSLYSFGTHIPDIQSNFRIKGSERIEKSTVILETEDKHLRVSQSLLDPASAQDWIIRDEDLSHYRKCGLDQLSKIYCEGSKSPFHLIVLNMASLYSRSAYTNDPTAKLVYMLSALESTLLKSESEPIQQNLSERVAVFCSTILEQRKAIIKNVKSVYDIRSKYLHHGHSSSELELLKEFFGNVWLFFVRLLEHSDRFKTKEEFVSAIDDHKLS